MTSLKLITVLTLFGVGVLQVCTANPVSVDEETDVTTLFTPDELQRARSAGITDGELMTGKSRGVTADEMIKLYLLAKSSTNPQGYDTEAGNDFISYEIEEMTKVCEVFVPQHKTATNYTTEQGRRLKNLMKKTDNFPREIQFLFVRKSLCPYISEPNKYEMDANSFGMKLDLYMEFRFWMMKNENVSGEERVNAAEELCCIYKGNDNVNKFKTQSTEFSLSNEKMTDFKKYWREFETANTSQAFEQVCDFLKLTNPSEEDC